MGGGSSGPAGAGTGFAIESCRSEPWPQASRPALFLRALDLFAALDLVGLVDLGRVLLAAAAIDRLLLSVPGVDRIVAVAARVPVHARAACELVVAAPAVEPVI